MVHEGRSEGRTDYLIKEAVETTASGTSSTIWSIDSWWQEQQDAAAADAAAKAKAAQDEADAKAKAAAAREAAKAKAEADRKAEEERKRQEEIEKQEQERRAKDAALQAKLQADAERVEREYILNKYKLYPFIKMKNFLKKNGIPKGEVDACLGKYELKKLSEKHSVDLPDDPKSL